MDSGRVQRDREPAEHEQPGDIAEVGLGPPHAEPVGDRVGGDGDPGRQGEADDRARPRAGPARLQQQRQPAADPDEPGKLPRSETFAQDQASERGDQQGSAAAGQRVDLVQVPHPVGLQQEQLVAGVQQHRHAQEPPAGRRRPPGQRQQQQRQHQGRQVQQHDRHQPVLPALEERVPGGVEDGGRQHGGDDAGMKPHQRAPWGTSAVDAACGMCNVPGRAQNTEPPAKGSRRQCMGH